jgi:basic amino acid/polyamine antiporter, APA family
MSSDRKHSAAAGGPMAAGGPVAPRRELSLFDSTSIIIGIIIGSGLYMTTPLVARNVPSTAWLLAFWAAGGAFALIGSLCFAELATAYPADGGDYVYLKRGFGPPMGFLFAWAQLWVIRPGSIGAMAYVFATYAAKLVAPDDLPDDKQFALLAAGPVIVLTVVNVLGVRQGKWTQNVLTGAKVLGLMSVFAIGLLFTAASKDTLPSDLAATVANASTARSTENHPSLFFAMILIVFTYGGWNDMAYVAAEVRDPSRNILRALVLGTTAVMGIYLLANIAFLHALGFHGVGQSQAVAADVAELALGAWGGRSISLLICISTLGAINGMIFTGARIYYAMGQDHRFFALVGRWSPRFGTPAWSLVIQAATTLAVVLGFGSLRGLDGFERLVNFTQPVFWSFLLASGISLFVLRRREPGHPRPYRVPGYPLVPLLFCGGCAVIVYASFAHAIDERSWEGLWSIGLMAVGAVLAWANRGGTMRQDVA